MFPQMALRAHMRMAVSPRLVLAHDVLRLSGEDLQTTIARELHRNPALSPRGSDIARARSSHSARLRAARFDSLDGDDPIDRLVAGQPALDHIASQVRLVKAAARDLDIAARLARMLDERGYLRVDPDALARELGVDVACVERAIGILQQVHPAGVGARDLRECLRLQCADLRERGVDCGLAPRLIETDQAWNAFAAQRWDRAARALNVCREDIERALMFMRANLYPYPLALAPDNDIPAPMAFPDVVIRNTPQAGRFSVEIPAAVRCALVVDDEFARAASNADTDALAPDQRAWMCRLVNEARAFMDALDQRWSTLRRIAEYLVEHQAGFFAHGARHLQPCTRAAVAQALGMHESTISRAVSDKIVQLPNGRLIDMGDLFDRSQAAKAAMRDLIAQTPGPLTDSEIARRLGAAGIILARRTVAKYREQLGIPARRARGRVA